MACGAAELSRRVAFSHMKKGTRRSGSPSKAESGLGLFQVVRQMLVHLEHADSVLAPEDLLQLVVSEDFSLVLRVLQVVLANVVPHLRDDLAARQGRVA